MNTTKLNELINIRNFSRVALEGINVQMSNEEAKSLDKKITELDRQILTAVLELEIEPTTKKAAKKVENS